MMDMGQAYYSLSIYVAVLLFRYGAYLALYSLLCFFLFFAGFLYYNGFTGFQQLYIVSKTDIKLDLHKISELRTSA